jgi:hypothetical protein
MRVESALQDLAFASSQPAAQGIPATARKAHLATPGSPRMAGPEKIDVRRAEDDKANAAKLAMLKELAKQAKPVGVEKKDERKK